MTGAGGETINQGMPVDGEQPAAARREPERRGLPRPAWAEAIETRIAAAVPVHPNVLSAGKLLVVAPLVLALKQAATLPSHPYVVTGLFLAFALLDYLDGAVARHRGQETTFGRFFDRATDYPILLAVAYFCLDVLPAALLAAKLALDLLLLVLYVVGRGSTENRVRTAMSYSTLLALLVVSQGWAPQVVTPGLVVGLLYVNVTFSSLVALYNLRVLRKRFLADALSAANALCGVFSMVFAARGRVDISLLFLLLGAAFDGFDGAAARKFGSTRWGVYSDDIADAINYGIAPGAALVFALGGVEGWVLGAAFTVFTLGRLVYFTLSKAASDPDYFAGTPSTVGALVVLCSLILFGRRPVLVGLMVGIACVQMVSFDTHYRHLGRALAAHRRVIYGLPILIVLLLTGRFFWSPLVPAGIILAVSLAYGFLPTAAHFLAFVRKTPGHGPPSTPRT